MSHDRARDTLALGRYIHAACMSFLNLSISRALVTTRRLLGKSHSTLYRCTLPCPCGLYHTSAAADTHLQYGWPWAGDIIAKAQRIVERVFKAIKNAVELTRPPDVCDNRQPASSEPCSPGASPCCRRHGETEVLHMQEILQ